MERIYKIIIFYKNKQKGIYLCVIILDILCGFNFGKLQYGMYW